MATTKGESGQEQELAKLREEVAVMRAKLKEINRESLKLGGERHLIFAESERVPDLMECFQLQSGRKFFFNRTKPFELFTKDGDAITKVNLDALVGESDCAFRGVEGDFAYFSTLRGKVARFFRLDNCNDKHEFRLEEINQMKTSEISLFAHEPFFIVERAREWDVYHYENEFGTEEGSRFDMSEVHFLSKYERHYQAGILYLFRESETVAIEWVNEKVVRVEGPLLEAAAIHAPFDSPFIYILNASARNLVVLNTRSLDATKFTYEAPADATHHCVVGVHKGEITLLFEGVWGRLLATARLAEKYWKD